MEHEILRDWANNQKVTIPDRTERMLMTFSRMIHETNQKFNLTGLKTLHDIIETLIIGSIEPFVGIKVPRGTVFADIGTGAGIPGIPLAIYSRDWRGILIDSNRKKISFVRSAITECRLDNCEAMPGRIEEIIRAGMRGACHIVVSRALGEIYYAVEMAAPLLKDGGLLYIYSHAAPDEVPEPVMAHAQELGLSMLERSAFADFGIGETGIAFRKTGTTENRYPRSTSIIKREMRRCARL